MTSNLVVCSDAMGQKMMKADFTSVFLQHLVMLVIKQINKYHCLFWLFYNMAVCSDNDCDEKLVK